ncbi:RHS repeat-associated core domain-containing protein [Clostridium estertheticum]|uniref:RHS repeat-associated core domain-containing protein n=1 Tax=Clostridium estertheticum TaxID=238834 RepID=UPI00227B2FF9|nr:RHS repeat-associated core domain-containing protein [Clostridium estertheticum]WAG73538.1 HNH endonuclease [Clostridium estertheticum]
MGNRYYYTQDEQGSTAHITDKEQQIKNEYCYDAFGNVLESTEDVHNRITYTGQQFDGITNQYYLRARFYNPVIGRFTQDDVYRGDGLNLYSYCGNNPVGYCDPSGYKSKCGSKIQAINDTEVADNPRSAVQYNTFHQFELDNNFYYASDSVQFRQANKSVVERLNSDTVFRKDMFRRNPELKTWLDNNPNLSNSPTELTWHHSEETGFLKLVDRTDHSTNSSIYHPTGNGGRDMWGGGKLGRIGKLDKFGKIKK